MRIRIYAAAVCFMLTSACSTTPGSGSTVRTAEAAGTAPITASSSSDTPESKALAKHAAEYGYHLEILHDSRRYCRTEMPMNSHIPHKECLNEAQLVDKLQFDDQLRQQESQAPRGPCVGGQRC